MARAREATVFLVDVGHSMRLPAAKDSAATCVDLALGAARTLMQQKLLFLPKHEVGVVFFGSAETKNELQASGYDEYQHVLVARDSIIDVVDLPTLRWIMGPPPAPALADGVSGLIVALDLMIKRTKDLKYQKVIRLFTDGQSVHPSDGDLEECAKQLITTQTRLHVTLVGDSAPGAWAALAAANPMVELLSLGDLQKETGSFVKKVDQRAKARMSLEISPDFLIPISMYTRTISVRAPTLRKRSKKASESAPSEHMKDAVKLERTYKLRDDPDGEEIKLEDRIKGHRYGSNTVPMSEYDEAALLYKCERTLTMLGFAHASSIGPEHSMKTVDSVAADRGDRWAFVAMESLNAAMLRDDLVMICRFSARKNAYPKMVSLWPSRPTEGSAANLELQYLPSMEDIREWPHASLAEPSLEQLDVASALIDAMDLEGAVAFDAKVGHRSKLDDFLRPEGMHNPALRRFYEFIIERALNRQAKVPAPTAQLLTPLDRPAHVQARLDAAKVGERLKAAFGLEKVEKEGKKTKRFWLQAVAEKREKQLLTEVDIKRIKVDAFYKKEEKEELDDRVKAEPASLDAGSGLAAAVTPAPRVHVGSVNTEADFERWLAYKGGGVDVTRLAIDQMQKRIYEFVDDGDAYYHEKALRCLRVLRRGCAQEGEVVTYNGFARDLRASGSLNRKKFWPRMRAEELGLITDAEASTSTVTQEEARAFLSGEMLAPPRPTGESPGGAVLSDKDLEAMIE